MFLESLGTPGSRSHPEISIPGITRKLGYRFPESSGTLSPRSHQEHRFPGITQKPEQQVPGVTRISGFPESHLLCHPKQRIPGVTPDSPNHLEIQVPGDSPDSLNHPKLRVPGVTWNLVFPESPGTRNNVFPKSPGNPGSPSQPGSRITYSLGKTGYRFNPGFPEYPETTDSRVQRNFGVTVASGTSVSRSKPELRYAGVTQNSTFL